LSSARIIVLEKSDLALELARELGADHAIESSDASVEEVLELTQRKGRKWSSTSSGRTTFRLRPWRW
jgi:NADPH:quinone reductase-like Zn-dependent oxidoreductase